MLKSTKGASIKSESAMGRPTGAERVMAAGRYLVQRRMPYLFILPAMAFVAIFSYYPAIMGLGYAFTDFRPGLTQTNFVGLDNFRSMADSRFLHAGARNLTILVIATMTKYVTVPFIVAALIYNIRPHRAQYWLRTMFVAPLIVPMMALLLLWREIYHPNTGLVNNALLSLGLDSLALPWLGDTRTALAAIIFIGFPWVVVLPFLIYLGGLMNIPAEITDAARIDGATIFRRIWSIDIPLLIPQFKLCAVLGFIFQMQGFWHILVLTGGGPVDATYTPGLEMYYSAFRFGDYGYASAVALVLFVIIMIGTVLNLTLVKSSTEYVA